MGKTIINIRKRKPYKSLEQALNKIREVRGYKKKHGNGEPSFYGSLTLPQILVGKKVKLVLVK